MCIQVSFLVLIPGPFVCRGGHEMTKFAVLELCLWSLEQNVLGPRFSETARLRREPILEAE